MSERRPPEGKILEYTSRMAMVRKDAKADGLDIAYAVFDGRFSVVDIDEMSYDATLRIAATFLYTALKECEAEHPERFEDMVQTFATLLWKVANHQPEPPHMAGTLKIADDGSVTVMEQNVE